MLKRDNTLFNEYKENLYRLNNIQNPNSYRTKIRKISELNTNFFNNDNNYIIKKNNILGINMNDTMMPLNREKNNFIEIKKNDLNFGFKNNKSFNKIIQKEIFLNNKINLDSPVEKRENIKNIPKDNNNNYFLNFNNPQNTMYNQKENRIKNIRISLKKIKLGNHRSLSKDQNQTMKNINNQTYIHKSPRRKQSLNTERSLLNHEKSNINNSYNYSKLLSKINISPKKNNFIPRPNIKHEKIRKNILSENIILGNKKVDKKLLDQSKEIKMQFKKENEIIKMKNEYFYKNGILPEQKINFENKTIKIQSSFRRFLSKKKLYHLKNKFFALKISKVNNIIINNQNKENLINNKNCLINRKYILKYLLFKKEQKIYNILQIYFNKFKKETLKNYVNKTQINSSKENNNNFKIKIMKINDIITQKIKRNKEAFFKYFSHYYYKNFFIDFNLFINIINKLEYIHKIDSYNNIFFNTKRDHLSYNKIENNLNNINKGNNTFLLSSLNDIKRLMKKVSETNSEDLKKFYLGDIIKIINKFDNEQKIIENTQKIKAFTIILISKINNSLIRNYNIFYYKLLFLKNAKKIIKENKENINHSKIEKNIEMNDINKKEEI